MNERKSLQGQFKILYPVLAIGFYLISLAVIFNTFGIAYSRMLYNLLLSLPLLGVMLMIFRRYPAAVIAASAAAFLLFYIDQFVYAARLTHIRFSDFKLIGQAVRVANRYKLVWSPELTKRLLIVIAGCAFLALIAAYYKLKYKRLHVFLIGLGLFFVGAVVLLSGVLPHAPETFDYTTDAEENGLLYSWYCQYRESKLTAPDGYSEENAERLLSVYTYLDGKTDVRVIVIMNESLTDYSLLGKTPFADPLENMHGYERNVFYGKLAVSVFGGGTCNTEYEFLTGNAMAFLPSGAIPFLQYVVADENSLARDLKEVGYGSTAIHPYYSEEWNRSQVYRFLGFDRFVSGADFGNTVVTNGMKATAVPSQNLISFGEGPLYVRGLISDRSCLERVLEEAEAYPFIFAVTMQNHGGYEYKGDDFENIEYVSESDRIQADPNAITRRGRTAGMDFVFTEQEAYSVNQFLTCTSLSDDAFKMLTDALEDSPQKTVVLMFGDHQPSLRIPEHFMQIEDFDESIYFDVPYILWANYEIEFDAPEYTSPNYLSAILKKNAGLPLTEWDQFRLDVMEEYPVVAVDHILDKDGNRATTEDLNDYAIVQYMRMFGG